MNICHLNASVSAIITHKFGLNPFQYCTVSKEEQNVCILAMFNTHLTLILMCFFYITKQLITPFGDV